MFLAILMTWLWDFTTMDSSYEICHSGCLLICISQLTFVPLNVSTSQSWTLPLCVHILSKTGAAVLGTADVGRKSFSQLSATRVAITKAHKPSKH